MGYVNKVFLMGNMTRDPELRYTPSGTPVCEFGMAMNRTYKDSQGNQKEDVCFVDVTFWRRRGEVISEYFDKGDPIWIEGRLDLDQWETPEGRRSKLRVQGTDFQFIGGNSGGQGQGRQGQGQRGGNQNYSPQNHPARQNNNQQSQQGQQGNPQGQTQQSQPSQSQSPPQQQSQGQGATPQENTGAQDVPDGGYDVSDDEIPF